MDDVAELCQHARKRVCCHRVRASEYETCGPTTNSRLLEPGISGGNTPPKKGMPLRILLTIIIAVQHAISVTITGSGQTVSGETIKTFFTLSHTATCTIETRTFKFYSNNNNNCHAELDSASLNPGTSEKRDPRIKSGAGSESSSG